LHGLQKKLLSLPKKAGWKNQSAHEVGSETDFLGKAKPVDTQ
jgi:hypothetical protein